ncbi:hypothetical protein IFM89_017849, partial [Coptis chinensis]
MGGIHLEWYRTGGLPPEIQPIRHLVVLPFPLLPLPCFIPSGPEPHTLPGHRPGFLSFTSLSANVYSPVPNSIFAIGPYRDETRLVSPPVFSTFTTEPSTAPFTPPSEPLHRQHLQARSRDNGSQNDDIVIGHGVSFELTAKVGTNRMGMDHPASMGIYNEPLLDEAKKPKLSILPEDYTIIDVDEYKAANDLPLPMFTKLTEVEI